MDNQTSLWRAAAGRSFGRARHYYSTVESDGDGRTTRNIQRRGDWNGTAQLSMAAKQRQHPGRNSPSYLLVSATTADKDRLEIEVCCDRRDAPPVSEPGAVATGSPLTRDEDGLTTISRFSFPAHDPVATAPGSDLLFSSGGKILPHQTTIDAIRFFPVGPSTK